MILTLDVWVVAQLIVLGLFAGTLGGMLGVGGSVIIIPGLTVILGYNQHLYQAVAMIANVAVAVPAALQHSRAGAMVRSVLWWMLPTALVFVMTGVWLSNLEMLRGAQGGIWLGRVLALFLLYVAAVNIRRLFRVRPAVRAGGVGTTNVVQPGVWRSGVVGAVMGGIAGLLGVGGGAIAVPLQQMMLRIPLRACIANSAAVMCVSAPIGAFYKNATLSVHDYHWYHSLSLALMLAPSCWLGSHIGAALTHRLPVRQVRVVFICLMIVAAVKMAKVF